MGAPLQRRRGIVEKAQALESRVHRIEGTLKTGGLGNGSVEVAFPVWFLDRPSWSDGWELEPSQALEVNNFPQVHVGVASWIMHTPIPHVSYYVGAVLAVLVTAGRGDQKLIIHWQAQGKALRSPRSDTTGSVDTVL